MVHDRVGLDVDLEHAVLADRHGRRVRRRRDVRGGRRVGRGRGVRNARVGRAAAGRLPFVLARIAAHVAVDAAAGGEGTADTGRAAQTQLAVFGRRLGRGIGRTGRGARGDRVRLVDRAVLAALAPDVGRAGEVLRGARRLQLAGVDRDLRRRVVGGGLGRRAVGRGVGAGVGCRGVGPAFGAAHAVDEGDGRHADDRTRHEGGADRAERTNGNRGDGGRSRVELAHVELSCEMTGFVSSRRGRTVFASGSKSATKDYREKQIEPI